MLGEYRLNGFLPATGGEKANKNHAYPKKDLIGVVLVLSENTGENIFSQKNPKKRLQYKMF